MSCYLLYWENWSSIFNETHPCSDCKITENISLGPSPLTLVPLLHCWMPAKTGVFPVVSSHYLFSQVTFVTSNLQKRSLLHLWPSPYYIWHQFLVTFGTLIYICHHYITRRGKPGVVFCSKALAACSCLPPNIKKLRSPNNKRDKRQEVLWGAIPSEKSKNNFSFIYYARTLDILRLAVKSNALGGNWGGGGGEYQGG